MKKFRLPLVIICVAVSMVMMVIGSGFARVRMNPANNISDTETEITCKAATRGTIVTAPKPTENIINGTTKQTETSVRTENNTRITTSKPTYIGRLRVTGYTDEEGFYCGSTTASGTPIGEGMCALNNTQRQELGISYGDKIYIDGLGTYTVVDCGCRYGVVDVWFWTDAEAYAITGYYNVYY